jgi:hypothetical protein
MFTGMNPQQVVVNINTNNFVSPERPHIPQDNYPQQQHVVGGHEKNFNAIDRGDIVGYTLVTPGNVVDNNTRNSYVNHPIS